MSTITWGGPRLGAFVKGFFKKLSTKLYTKYPHNNLPSFIWLYVDYNHNLLFGSITIIYHYLHKYDSYLEFIKKVGEFRDKKNVTNKFRVPLFIYNTE